MCWYIIIWAEPSQKYVQYYQLTLCLLKRFILLGAKLWWLVLTKMNSLGCGFANVLEIWKIVTLTIPLSPAHGGDTSNFFFFFWKWRMEKEAGGKEAGETQTSHRSKLDAFWTPELLSTYVCGDWKKRVVVTFLLEGSLSDRKRCDPILKILTFTTLLSNP